MTNDLMRDVIEGRIPMPAKPKPPTLADAFESAWKTVTDAFQEVYQAFLPTIEALQDIGVIEAPPPADPRERALWAKQERGHGPAVPVKERGLVTKYKEKP